MRTVRIAVLFISVLTSLLIGCEPARIVVPDTGPGEDAPPLDTASLPDAPDAATAPALTAEETIEGSLSTPRLGHTLTLLPSGRALVIGGETLDRDALTSIEELDPTTHVWTEVAELPVARSNHTATLLADGRVLIVGGGRSTSNGLPAGLGVSSTAVLYDPVAHTFEETAPLAHGRGHHAAITLTDGSVLIVGGAGPGKDEFTVVPEAERYVPATESFVPAGELAAGRAMLRVELDGDGAPLVLGGLTSEGGIAPVGTIERWSDDAFTAAGNLLGGGRIYHATLRTSGGDVLVVGGLGAGIFLDSTEVLASDGEAFVAGPDLPTTRNTVAVVETPRGVLAIGGFSFSGSASLYDEVLHFDVAAGTLTTIGNLPLGRAAHRAVTLPDGDVLVVGGYGAFGEITEALRVHVAPSE
jgi:large repetitive protein